MNGKLIFRYGTMGSSKSAHLLMCGYNFELQDKHVLYLKPSIDTRSKNIWSRIGIKHKCVPINLQQNLLDLIQGNVHIVLIDECQFLSAVQVEQLAWLADNSDILIICYGLRTDANSILFPGSKRLFELSDKVDEIKSTCSCGRKTIINALKGNTGYVLSDKQINIRGAEYNAVCRKCWKDNLCN